MNKCLTASIAGFLATVLLAGCATAPYRGDIKEDDVAVTARPAATNVLVADFETGEDTNNIGGKFGAWDKDPNDDTQGARASLVAPGFNGKGRSLKLAYDVDSPETAYNGFWMKLENLDIRQFRKLSFWIRGDAGAGCTSKFKIELKNAQEVSPYYVNRVNVDWHEVVIPLSAFQRISDWSGMTELVIVFEDAQVTEKTGILYLDQISFRR